MNNLKTTFLLASMMGLCMLVGHFAFGGWQGMLIGVVFGGLGNIIAFFFSDKIAIASMGGQEVQRSDVPWLFDMIERLTTRAGLPMPRIYVSPQAAPNAFATGRSPRRAAVAITQGMLRSFPQHEIEAVMAHELGHIRHRDMLISTVAAVMAGMISYAGYMVFWFGGGRRDGEQNPLAAIGAILMLILAPIAAMLIQLAISRSREFAADRYSGELTGNPLNLAAALERLTVGNERIPTDTNPAFHALCIVQPFTRAAVRSLGSTHPPVEQRIAALRRQAQEMR